MIPDEIALVDIYESPTNPREYFDHGALMELMDSIIEHGVFQPVVVRRNVNGGVPYELVVGARRFRACERAKIRTIPAIVRNLTDEQVLEMQLVENKQRETVLPVEEAKGMHRCLVGGVYGPINTPHLRGVAVRALASKLGVSEKYVYDRLKLLTLTGEALEELSSNNLPAGHAILLARIPIEEQEAALTALLWNTGWAAGDKQIRTDRLDAPKMSVRQFDAWLDANVRKPLDGVQFDVRSEDLLPIAGSCIACQKRTGLDDGDPEDLSGQRCLDKVCFASKLKEFAAKRLVEAEAELQQKPRQITTDYSGRGNTLGTYQYSVVKPDSKGAVPAIVTSGRLDQIGELVYIRENAAGNGRGMTTQAAKSGDELAARKEELQRGRVENLARARILEACLEALKDPNALDPGVACCELFPVLVLKLAARNKDYVGLDWTHRGPSSSTAGEMLGVRYGEHPTADDLKKVQMVDDHQLFAAALIAGARDEIAYGDYRKPAANVLLEFASLLQIDVELIRREAEWDSLSKKQQAERMKGGEKVA